MTFNSYSYFKSSFKNVLYSLIVMYICYFCAHTLIDDYKNNAIGMVTESVRPSETESFPSIAVCEIGYTKETYIQLEEIIER